MIEGMVEKLGYQMVRIIVILGILLSLLFTTIPNPLAFEPR
jgi:hypothetical protein